MSFDIESFFEEQTNIKIDTNFIPYVIDLVNFTKTDKWNFFNRMLLKKYKFSRIPKKIEVSNIYRTLIRHEKIKENKLLEQHIMTSENIKMSGILALTIATKPDKISCKFDCHYCPKEPDQPRSYLSNEPVLKKAVQCGFDTVKQFLRRTSELYIMEHKLDKLEVIVLGGTWSCYPVDYQEEFIRDLYYSSNVCYDFIEGKQLRDKLTLEEEQIINETAMCRIISITLETRPDMITPEEIIRFRRYGCTRVQIGVQHVDDSILKAVGRRCYYNDTVKAIKLLKDNGFKIDIHLMPNLPTSTPEKDIAMFEHVIMSPDMQVDQWKIYPCEVIKFTKIYDWFMEGKYIPYPEDELKKVIKYALTNIPYHIRINRIVRDIQMCDVIAGISKQEIRLDIQTEMEKEGLLINDIRCREVKTKEFNIDDIEIIIRKFESSKGIEYFISHESKDKKTLYSLLRLRINSKDNMCIFDDLKSCTMIREIHVYGEMIKHDEKTTEIATQHRGLGKELIKKAIEISKEHGFTKIAVISGIGANKYYIDKHGFERSSHGYLIKNI